MSAINRSLLFLVLVGVVARGAEQPSGAASSPIGRIEISTIPFSKEYRLQSATYTPSGKVLVAYGGKEAADARHVNLAVMDDDGKNMRPFFSQTIPPREKDNGLRYMVFADNQRIFLGDFIIECAPSIDVCERSSLLPVTYPNEIAGGANVAHRWSEMIVAPDNEHIAWTTLLANYSAVVFIGKLEKEKASYKIAGPQIISTLEAFRPDPNHPDGVVPNPVRNGEVKQFVAGGTAISLVGALRRDIADSVVQDLTTGDLVQITDTPGYDETTIFSPDEKLGITMSSRFSPSTDLAILGLMPRPYPTSLNMGLNMNSYTYAVTGVRQARRGNVGPALIDIQASKTRKNYQGTNLNTEDEWVFRSPMSWHPDSKRAMWLEGRRSASAEPEIRMQVVRLPDYAAGKPIAAKRTPSQISYASADMSVIERLVRKGGHVDVKVYGRRSGHIDYRRTAKGAIEKLYVDYSDDGQSVYTGSETMQLNPQGNSTYTAKVKLSGPRPGVMDLKMTFGPLRDELPARLLFTRDQSGVPITHGYTEYDGQRLGVERLVP